MILAVPERSRAPKSLPLVGAHYLPENGVKTAFYAGALGTTPRQCGVRAYEWKVFFDKVNEITDQQALGTRHQFAFHQTREDLKKLLPRN